MKNLKTYKMFESSVELTPEQVEWLDECTDGTYDTWQLNPQTGLVDVEGDFSCSGQGLSDFKGVRFGVVGVNFWCHNNQLTTLEGAPQKVGGSFWCNNNQLTTLEGAPQKVGGGFNCQDNQLTTLKGAPKRVGRDFHCENNQLTSLEGAPREVRWDFNCNNNQLTSLKGAPQKVGEDLYCRNNPVSEKTLGSILVLMMKNGESYLESVEYLWTEIPVEDQALLYRPEFEWVGPDEVKKLDALRAYQGFKGMI